MIKEPLEDLLRRERNERWARHAHAAKTDSDTPENICRSWSQDSDYLLSQAFAYCFGSSKIALFALGKLGSSELNLSSDVDILLIAENDEAVDLSALRKFQKLLAERTPEGYVFRVDFDLRPGGKQGPLLPTVDQFKDYYGNYGETWERLAMVRLRPIAGDPRIQDSIMQFARKFSFRRHLDFTLLEDLKNLRSKIQGHYWARSQEHVVDLKLGIGGIRDVELFTHALQVLHAGRDTSLQIKGTTAALALLEEKKLLPSEDAQFLKSHYWNLRRLENYVQALHDEQTHLLNEQEFHPEFVIQALKTLRADMRRCDSIVKTLLGEAPLEVSLEENLKKVGLNEEDLRSLWEEILEQKVLSRSKARDEAARTAFLSAFFEALKEQNGDIRKGLLFLKDFVQGTRAKATFFSMLLREKELLKKLAWLFGHSPYLSRILCNRPELLDSFVYRAQDTPSEDLGTLLEELAEKRLLSEIVNGSDFLERKEIKPLLKNLSSTADSIVLSLIQALRREYPSAIRVLALGKWGGQELGFRSDLDFIFVLKDEPTEVDFKFAKRFISRLTESHRGGNIYSIDMRLRPSGKAGPLVIEEKDLQNYLQNEAAAWERQAYCKARWIEEPFSPSPTSWFIARGLTTEDLAELERIRGQLTPASADHVNLKYSEGGLVDVELAAQTAVLVKKILPGSSSTESFFTAFGPRGELISRSYAKLRQVEQMLQLVASESLHELHENHESFQSLALALQTRPSELLVEIKELLAANRAFLAELDPRRLGH